MQQSYAKRIQNVNALGIRNLNNFDGMTRIVDQGRAERLRLARERAGFARAADAAKALSANSQTYHGHENGNRGFDADTGARYAKKFNVDYQWLMTGTGRMDPAGRIDLGQEQSLQPAPPAVAGSGAWPRDIPILGVTVGGTTGDFAMNMGEPADYAKRPLTVPRVGKLFALYVQGSSMVRWRQPGQLVYLDPVRPAKPGDHVVVELYPEVEGDGHPAYLKELVARTGTKVRLLQYNPETVIEIPTARVRHIHRVMEWEELLGV
jgi:phage repressor protein C with HTH and peptisase S24 domain